MSILHIKQTALTADSIEQWSIITDSTLAQVTVTGFLSTQTQGSNYAFQDDSWAAVRTTDFGTLFMQINVSSNGQVATLVNPYEGIAAGVSFTGTPTVGNFAVWDSATGIIEDLGYLPTNAAKTKVVMANAAVIANHLACFTDTAGTVDDDAATAINAGNLQAGLSGTAGYVASFPGTAARGSLRLTAVANTGDTLVTVSNALHGQASVISIPDGGQATSNFIISNSAGTQTIATGSLALTLGSVTATAGNLQAGSSGNAGIVSSFPGTASKGSLRLVAVANTGDTLTTISNAAMGQASVVSIPDPAAATANFVVAPAALVSGNAVKASGTAGLVIDAGYNIKSATTASYAGGGTSNAFTATGLTSSSIVTASILTSTNAVSITKVVPTTNTLTVTFSADPGASTTVNWIATSAAVA